MSLPARAETLPKTPWEEKTIPKLFWRGTLTGAFHNWWTPWQKSQRERMSYLVIEKDVDKEVLVDMGDGKVELRKYEAGKMNEMYMDVAPVGGAMQVGFNWLEESWVV